jgi:alpha-aminoadipate/glutamate carrier protein LysW
MVKCPNCDGVIDVDDEDVEEGDSISCDECGADLTVTGVDPLEVESSGSEEDEDDDEDFLDDDDDAADEEEEEEEEDDWK